MESEEEEWEEQLVAIELVGMIDPDKLNMIDDQNTAVLGVSSDEMTVLKLGGYAFAGKYEDVVGSIVIFEDVSGEDEEPKLKYMGNTTKVIQANRIFLKPKAESLLEKSKVVVNDEEDVLADPLQKFLETTQLQGSTVQTPLQGSIVQTPLQEATAKAPLQNSTTQAQVKENTVQEAIEENPIRDIGD